MKIKKIVDIIIAVVDNESRTIPLTICFVFLTMAKTVNQIFPTSLVANNMS